MTEFKQIIGRGTRINEDFGKYWFTIMAFKKATELFADHAFDGHPVVIYAPEGSEPPVPPDDLPEGGGINDGSDAQGDEAEFTGEEGGNKRIKYIIDSIPIYVIAERVQYYSPDGRLITESLHDYPRACVQKQFSSLDDFRADQVKTRNYFARYSGTAVRCWRRCSINTPTPVSSILKTSKSSSSIPSARSVRPSNWSRPLVARPVTTKPSMRWKTSSTAAR